MIKRVLGGILGAVMCAILVPFLYSVVVGVPEPAAVLAWLAGGGSIVGAILGARFPGVFGGLLLAFIAEA